MERIGIVWDRVFISGQAAQAALQPLTPFFKEAERSLPGLGHYLASFLYKSPYFSFERR